jgi:tetrahedral aminopeptidase
MSSKGVLMISKAGMNFLEELLISSSISGFETEAAAIYRKYLQKYCDSVYTDVMGNTIGAVNTDSNFKVMLAGHYDEIGFQVVHISDEGLISFRNVGGIDKVTVPGTEVEIQTAKGKIPGIIGKKPIHLIPSKERDKILLLKELWIDIGSDSKKETEKSVSIGDPISVKPNFIKLGKHKIMSKGLDDKIGAFVVAETVKKISKYKKIDIGVYCVGTVQEEVGLRGAQTAAYKINPNVGIAVDVGFATDTPDINVKEYGSLKLGKGPILTRFANENPVLGKKIRAIAKSKNIPCQEEAGYSASGGTDTASIQLARNGVATALVSIPNRYMHTPVEICDIRDVENTIELLSELILSLKPGNTFIPGID